MYSNAAGIIPVVEALLGKGAALGTVLAFMMSVIALSLPEMIILRKVLTLRLIAVFVGVVGAGILAVGFLFNCSFQLNSRRQCHERRESPWPRLRALHQDRRDGEGQKRRKLASPSPIEKVTDYAAIAGYGIASTPGIVIDGKVVHAGGLPRAEDLATWLKA